MKQYNSCGDCTACCTVLSVPEINKDAGVKCDKLCNKGCSIYKDRPDSCKHIKCAYLLSPWREEWRPDKSGLLVVAFNSGVSVFKIKDKINNELKEVLNKIPKVTGYDCRNLYSS